MKNDKLFLANDGKTGYALDPDGDLQNLFNNGPRGGGKAALDDAVKNGATTLDAFDGHLPALYSKHGFVPTGRMKFNDEYAPKGWDYAKYGRPDIVSMAYRGGDRATAAQRTGSYKPYDPTAGAYFTDYDLAKAASRGAVVDKGTRPGVLRFDGDGVEHRGRGLIREELEDTSGRSAESGTRFRGLDKAAHDVSDEPRDPGGKWTDGGGDGGGGSSSGGGGKGKHPGPGYSPGARVDSKGVIQTSNVYDAQRALFEDRKVELKQVKQISTLIKRLGETAKEMAEHGETAPTFNLCNVSVKGTNLFCADQIGIPRVEMPVIKASKTKDFIKYLKKQGYKVENDKEEARNLRATQSEISGEKVAASMARIKEEGFYKRLVVSKDDYILDGHHTWAGQLAVDAEDGNLKNDGREVKIARVNISITKLVAEAEKWTGGKGKKPATEKPAEGLSVDLTATGGNGIGPRDLSKICRCHLSLLCPQRAFGAQFRTGDDHGAGKPRVG